MSYGTRKYTLGLPGFIVGAWLLMIGLGVAHASSPAVPALGYWPCLIIMAAFAISTEVIAKFSWER